MHDGTAGGRCISAWAEEPVATGPMVAADPVHLRVGGGTQIEAGVSVVISGASPRGRRNLDNLLTAVAAQGCISAWAEEPALSEPR